MEGIQLVVIFFFIIARFATSRRSDRLVLANFWVTDFPAQIISPRQKPNRANGQDRHQRNRSHGKRLFLERDNQTNWVRLFWAALFNPCQLEFVQYGRLVIA